MSVKTFNELFQKNLPNDSGKHGVGIIGIFDQNISIRENLKVQKKLLAKVNNLGASGIELKTKRIDKNGIRKIEKQVFIYNTLSKSDVIWKLKKIGKEFNVKSFVYFPGVKKKEKKIIEVWTMEEGNEYILSNKNEVENIESLIEILTKQSYLGFYFEKVGKEYYGACNLMSLWAMNVLLET